MRVMIIGGTSGIGLALAAHYAAQGAELALCGRDTRRLGRHPLAEQGRAALYDLDVADAAAVQRAVGEFSGPGLDLLIVTAGSYADAATLAAEPSDGMALIETNIAGLCHAFSAAAAAMCWQRRGHLVAVASIAGLLDDYPGASLYSASKRAAIAVCDSYRKALAPFGIAVTAIVPGYIDTQKLRDLNGGTAQAKPFLLSEAEAVRRTTKAIAAREARCVFPWQLYAQVRLFNALPAFLQRFRKK